MAWGSAAEVYEEYRELTRGRFLDVTGVSHDRLRERPVQWPAPDRMDHEEKSPFYGIARSIWEREEEEHPGTPRLYVDKKFNTPNGRARFAPTPHASPKR